MQKASPLHRMSNDSRRELMLEAWNSLKGATWPMRIRMVQKLNSAIPTPAQMGVLQALLSNEAEITPRELSGCLHVTPGTVTGNLNALEDDGLIERVRVPGDRRVIHIRITPKGRERVKKWRAIFEEQLQEHFAPLSDAELRQLASLLERLGPPPGKTGRSR
jgi:DNA-binding MarR family transcriptional regulator